MIQQKKEEFVGEGSRQGNQRIVDRETKELAPQKEAKRVQQHLPEHYKRKEFLDFQKMSMVAPAQRYSLCTHCECSVGDFTPPGRHVRQMFWGGKLPLASQADHRTAGPTVPLPKRVHSPAWDKFKRGGRGMQCLWCGKLPLNGSEFILRRGSSKVI